MLKISNTSRATVLADRAELAATFWRRLWGLMGRAPLGDGEGLVIVPNGSVHTFWMRFPIDVVFVDKAGVVVGLREAMPPNRPYAGARRAYRTIELPAGVIGRTGTQRGDLLQFETV
jgi:uncharacterized protein